MTTKIPEKIGVFGGTFDPIHFAHIALARAAISQCELDLLIAVPCHIPAHKQTAKASAEHRLNMLRLALASETQIVISEYELDKPETSYTVETLDYFEQIYPGAEKVFCLGADSLRSLKSWYRWEQILESANLAVMGRSGFKKSDLDPDIVARIVKKQEKFSQGSGQIKLLDTDELSVSATELRLKLKQLNEKEIQADSNLSQWLHPDVLKYLCDTQVYR